MQKLNPKKYFRYFLTPTMTCQSKQTIFSLLETQFTLASKNIALVEGSINKTYGDLYDSVLRTADYLRSLGVKSERPIMLVGENSIALCTLLLAAAKIGVCVVMENARRVSPEIIKIIECSSPSHIFYLHGNSGDAKRHSLRAHAEMISTGDLGEFGLVPRLDQEPKGLIDEDTAIIIYTTGSTGTPKGVMLSHENLSYIAKMMKRYREINSDDKIYAILPFTHVMGCASVLLGGLYGGATLFLSSRFSSKDCVDLVLRYGITVIQGAPAMFAKIIEYCNANGVSKLGSIRFIGAGGAPLDSTLKKRAKELFGCELQNGYGLTEAASICWTRLNETNNDDSVGRPLEGIDVIFRDASGNILPDGEVGELWCRGPNLMRGYFDNPSLTHSSIDADGWFNTNDLGFRGSDGRIFIVGRTKDLIIKSGFNVYPLEIESLLNSHPLIMHSAVVGRLIEGNEEIHAFVELTSELEITKTQIAEFLVNNLSPYKRPDFIHIVRSLPIAVNGKVMKSQLSFENTQH